MRMEWGKQEDEQQKNLTGHNISAMLKKLNPHSSYCLRNIHLKRGGCVPPEKFNELWRYGAETEDGDGKKKQRKRLCWQDNAGINIFIIQWDRVSSTGAVELILPCFVWVWYRCYEIRRVCGQEREEGAGEAIPVMSENETKFTVLWRMERNPSLF